MANLNATAIFLKWQLMSKPKLEKFMEDYKNGEHKEEVEMACGYFRSTPSYQKGQTDTNCYKICCEMVNYCSFYVRPWFYLLCADVVLLLLLIGTTIAYCYYRKRRGGGGTEFEEVKEPPKKN